jgi:hypothetical protein
MKKVLISFGNETYRRSLKLLKETADSIGNVDESIMYTKEDFGEKFAYRNAYILSKPRGAGYCIWKPYLILKTMKDLEDGDVVLYTDGGIKIIEDLAPLYDLAVSTGEPILFKVPAVGIDAHIGKAWIKRDCFVLMGADTEEYWKADMVNAAMSLWVKNEKTIAFLKEWSRYMKDPRIVTDEGNLTGNADYMEFKAHRYDQSVLTILGHRHGIEMYRDPTQWGSEVMDEYENSPYKQLMHHHRNFKH